MKKKQAVVLIHGIGDQKPMESIMGFVEAVWSTNGNIRIAQEGARPKYWIMPDTKYDSHEMRRITTNSAVIKGGEGGTVRTDFYEVYWQDMMGGNTLTHVIGWLLPLLGRAPTTLTGSVRKIWWAVIALLPILGLSLASWFLPDFGLFDWLEGYNGFGSSIVQYLPNIFLFIAAMLFIWKGAFVKYIGDAARYLHNSAGNVSIRNHIRKRAIDLLRSVHDSGDYDRVVLVGHSLGSLVAYDALSALWANYRFPNLESRDNQGSEALSVLREVEKAAEGLERIRERQRNQAAPTETLSSDDFEQKGLKDELQAASSAYLAAKHRYREQLSKSDPPWKISDFITLGSPLAHANMLVVASQEAFSEKVNQRWFPTDPPQMETFDSRERFSYRSRSEGNDDSFWKAHHAAVFGSTRWTNLYFPEGYLYKGDPIGGPVGPLFGPGVADIKVSLGAKPKGFQHTKYWDVNTAEGEKADHLQILRDRLNLDRKDY